MKKQASVRSTLITASWSRFRTSAGFRIPLICLAFVAHACSAPEVATPSAPGELAVATEPLNGTVAKVNGVEISSDQLHAELEQNRAAGYMPSVRAATLERQVLACMVDRELIAQAVDRSGLAVPGERSDPQAFERLLAAEGRLSVSDAEAISFMEQNELTGDYAELEGQIARSIRQRKLVEQRREVLLELRREAEVELFLPELPVVELAPSISSLFGTKLNDGRDGLTGLVDLHAHPMAHLAHGQKVLFGVPDVNARMPFGTTRCDDTDQHAAWIGQALGSCQGIHGGHNVFDNPCGNHVRRLVLNGMEDGKGANKPHDKSHPSGYPLFRDWPKHDDILHQSMWIDWVKRAYDGGLRVMVGLAVNSVTLAVGTEGDLPSDDTGKLQITEMKRLAERHDWIEIAYGAEDLRRIVGQDRLALILGVELDDLTGSGQVTPTEEQVRSSIRDLYAEGVRYMFPLHVVDNPLGGTGVYEPEFARANRFQFGSWWDLGCAAPDDDVTLQIPFGWDVFISMKLGSAGGTQPTPRCPGNIGYVNRRGLQAAGRVALEEMMRLGVLIDIDHMSLRTVDDTLDFTRPWTYPLLSGHNAVRRGKAGLEIQRTEEQYAELAGRSGLAGVTWADTDAKGFMQRAASTRDTGIAIALGTDANGLAKAPRPRAACQSCECVSYSPQFPAASTAFKTWDYNEVGVAHYGLMPDFLQDVQNLGGGAEVQALLGAAEAFAVAWERSEGIAASGVDACAEGACSAPQDVGLACNSGSDCPSGYCIRKPWGAPEGQCWCGHDAQCGAERRCRSDNLCVTAQGEDGALCDRDGQCINACIRGVCQARRAEGELCGNDADCESRLCSGDRCGCNVDAECGAGRRCRSDHQCVTARGEDGQPCDRDGQCINACIDGACQPRRPWGAPCQNNADCMSCGCQSNICLCNQHSQCPDTNWACSSPLEGIPNGNWHCYPQRYQVWSWPRSPAPLSCKR